MRRRTHLMAAMPLALLLAGCASAPQEASVVEPAAVAAPVATSAPSADPELPAAEAQAQAWLDAVTMPPSAVAADRHAATFGGTFGWPCTPVTTVRGYWTLQDTTVADTAEWVVNHPPADLVSTLPGEVEQAVSPDPASFRTGFIPADGSMQGVVITVVEATTGGVAVRAEVAALTASATCPSLPPGESYGAPGQG